MQRPVIGLGLFALLLLSGVVHAKPKKTDTSSFTPASSVFLRNAYDADPSAYIGRFIKTGTPPGAIDEASTYQSACSAFIKPKVVDGGGVFYDEFFNASLAAKLSAGISRIAEIGVSARDSSVMRVKYTLAKKMQSVIDDPAGFKSCCLQAPDQCTDRYIGEFLMGSGAAYVGASSKVGVTAKVEQGLAIPGLDIMVFPQLEISSSMAWFRGTAFPNPVYFAFKTYDMGFDTTQENGCGDWVSGPPRSTEGVFFVGVSPVADSEAAARDLAQKNARVQTVKYLGELISTGTVQVTNTVGAGSGVTSAIADASQVESFASGIARFVRDEAYCVTPIDTAAGRTYSAKVLAILPNASVTDAARTLTGPPVK